MRNDAPFMRVVIRSSGSGHLIHDACPTRSTKLVGRAVGLEIYVWVGLGVGERTAVGVVRGTEALMANPPNGDEKRKEMPGEVMLGYAAVVSAHTITVIPRPAKAKSAPINAALAIIAPLPHKAITAFSVVDPYYTTKAGEKIDLFTSAVATIPEGRQALRNSRPIDHFWGATCSGSTGRCWFEST